MGRIKELSILIEEGLDELVEKCFEYYDTKDNEGNRIELLTLIKTNINKMISDLED